MELLTTTDLQALTHDEEHSPAVSIFMPTSRVSVEVQADQLRWKNLIGAVETALHDDGIDKAAAATLLAPAWELHADVRFWQHVSDGLAVFLRPGWHRIVRVPVAVPQVATVGDRFVVSPLLGAISSEDHFLVLAVSQQKVRLLEGTRHHVEEVELRDVPTNLRDVIEAPDPRSDTMTRSLRGGRVGPAVFHGHGAGDDTFKNDEAVKFFRRVDDGLRRSLADQNRPMVLVGLERNVAAYRKVNTYPRVLDQAVHHNPDQMSADQLHDAAWPIAHTLFSQSKRAAVERLGELIGTGLASTTAATIHAAAQQGRVDTLFVTGEPSCWNGTVGGRPSVVRLGDEQELAACELLDRCVLATLLNGGEIYTTSDSSMLNGGLMAATFRY
jgi:hypothetical protein